MEKAEVVVCGAGHNALTAAAFIAKSGVDVLVLEKNDFVGGGLVSREIPDAPGFICNPHAQGIVLMAANPVITHDELGLRAQFGLETIPFDTMYATQFDDGEYIVQYCDVDKTCASIARYSPRDAEAYRHFASMAARLLPLLSQGLFAPPTPLGSLFMMLDQSREGRLVLSEMMNSAYNIIDKQFEHPRVKMHFMHYVAELMVSPEQSGTGIVPYLLTGLIHSVVPFRVKGGSQRLSDALARCVEHHGGRIRTGARVAQIEASGGRATGVILDTGERIEATRAVMAGIHPHDIGEMVPGVDPMVAKQASRVQLSNFGAMNTHVALKEFPNYHGGAEVNRAMMVECVPYDMEAFRRSFDEMRYGYIPQYNNYNVANLAWEDPTVVPEPGNCSLYLYKFVPLELADGGNAGWAKVKEETSRRFVENYGAYVTNWTQDNIGPWFSETPQDMYEHNPVFRKGDIFGCGTFLNQFFSYRPTPELGQYVVPGCESLYLVGPTQHPGGGITGGGRAPAIRLLGDLGVATSNVFAV